jgi:phosphatidate cytidylyltransferase
LRTDPSLWHRVLSAAIFLPILAWLIHAGMPWYGYFCDLVLVLALVEFYRMGPAPLPWWACLPGLVALAGTVLFTVLPRVAPHPAFQAARSGSWLSGWSALLLLALAVLAAEMLRGGRPGSATRVGRALLGFLYLGGLGSYLYALRWLGGRPGPGDFGAQATAIAYVLTWTADTGAYAVGLGVGKRPLAPAISPRKTWEGALGGLAASVLVGALTGALVWKFLGAGRGALLGLLVGLAGQLGDLLESMLKREYQAKDSASWIPGHGGVLDRFDSLLAAAPVVYYFLLWGVLR